MQLFSVTCRYIAADLETMLLSYLPIIPRLLGNPAGEGEPIRWLNVEFTTKVHK